MRPETQKQQTAANSRIKTSAAEGVLKDLRDLCEGNRVLSEVKIFQDWRFVVHMSTVFDVLRRFRLCKGFPVLSRKTHRQKRKR